MADGSDNQAVADPGPGVHVVVHADPRRAARMVADAVGGYLIEDAQGAESAVAQRLRLPAARAAQAESLGDRDHLARLARRRPLDDGVSRRLLDLGRELFLIQLALAATDSRLLQPFVNGSGAVATSPAHRDGAMAVAAAAVVAEEAALADARWSLTLLDDEASTDTDTNTDSEPNETPSVRDEGVTASIDFPAETGDSFFSRPEIIEGPRHDGSVLMPMGLFLIGLFIAIMALLTGLSPAIAAGAVGLAIVAAALSRYSIKHETPSPGCDGDGDGEAAARHNLALATSSDVTPAAVGVGVGPRATRPAPSDHGPRETAAEDDLDERSRRTRAISDAAERLALAERTWQATSRGVIDPHSIDWAADPAPAVGIGATVLAVAPAARALRAVRATMLEEWNRTWNELGRAAPPPDRGVLDLVLADLRETAPDPAEARARLAQVSEAERRKGLRKDLQLNSAPDAQELDDTPLVLMSPFNDLSEDRQVALRRKLEQLEPDLTVVIVVQTGDELPALS